MVDFVFLDSGTGGIPYLTHLLQVSPTSSCVYVGDTKNFPYGEKTHEQIVNCVLAVVDKIVKKFDPKIIVIACNTMSVNTLDILREVHPEIQFVGTVPAIKVAASISKKRKIGLLATRSTCEHPYNVDLKNHFASDCDLILRADPELISFIEHKSFTATIDECKNALMPAVEFFAKNDCDTIILGCTHFLNLSHLFQEVCDTLPGIKIQIVDSREGVTNRALSLLKNNDCSTPCNSTKNEKIEKSKLYITGFSEAKDKAEYDVICNRFGLDFGGML